MSAPNTPLPWTTLLGAPIHCLREQFLPLEIPSSGSAHALEAVRHFTLSRGQAQQSPSAFNWTHKTDTTVLRIGLVPEKNRTRLWVQGQYSGLAGIVFVATIFAGLFLFSGLFGFLVKPESLQSALAVFLAGVALAYLLARRLWKYIIGTRQQELDKLLEQLAGYLSQASLYDEAQESDSTH
ncbi:MAG: hypothetical protein GKR89_04355 [Candidatus Latescibacteria bacterium]|nr:hypothetical protein [Candidatus Latescibacterota bacterium]